MNSYYSLVTKSCPTLCDPMDCSLTGSSVHEISQAKILEWLAMSFFRGNLWTRNEPLSPALVGRFFTTETPGKLYLKFLASLHFPLKSSFVAKRTLCQGNLKNLQAFPSFLQHNNPLSTSPHLHFPQHVVLCPELLQLWPTLPSSAMID